MNREIISELSEKTISAIQKWQYLLFQEQCRLCKRWLHPQIDSMNLNFYRAPAEYVVGKRVLISDSLCQFCHNSLSIAQAALNVFQYSDQQELLVVSARIFIEPINTLIYRFKYDGDILLAKDLACLMLLAWPLLQARVEFQGKELCFVPVPLHNKKLHKRGFNQSELLARYLARCLDIKVESKLLQRIKNTAPQQELDKSQRLKNVKGAFRAAHSNAFVSKEVILVDDVCTSGSTLIESAKAVTDAGASNVHGITTAYVP